MILFFFFQAEDGIRDYKVTGVQTCALPISRTQTRTAPAHLPAHGYGSRESLRCAARRARRTSKAGPARGTRRRPRPRALGSVFFPRAVRAAGQASLASIAAFPSPVNAKQRDAYLSGQRRR